MAIVRQYSGKRGEQYDVVRYEPGELASGPGSDGLVAALAAIKLVAGIGKVYARTGEQLAAEALAGRLGKRPGTHWVASAVHDAAPKAYAYAARRVGGAVLRFSEVEVFDAAEPREDCRRHVAIVLHAAIADSDASAPVETVRIGRRPKELPEDRSQEFFTDVLGMALKGGPRWGDPGSYMEGPPPAILAAIENQYGVPYLPIPRSRQPGPEA